VLPLFFVVFVISFPAGVIVYWITTNSWTILQQYIVRKRLGPMGPPVTAAGPSAGDGGGSPRGGDSGGGGPSSGGNGNGSGSGGGLGGLLSRVRGSEQSAVATKPRTRTVPPPPPKKKKKRSGRRR
jgi:YidC/Oxa1 family membrane protein insertase